MRITPKLRSFLPLAALALLAVALLAPQASAASKIPPLSTTAQFKALNTLVIKLQKLQGQPTTAAQKTAYEGELTTKHAAALARSTALFTQGKKAAKRETQDRFKTASTKARKAEAKEIGVVQDEYANRLGNAADGYQQDQEALEDNYGDALAKLRRLISDLRVSKAKAKGPARKSQIQDEINRLVERVTDTSKQRSTDRLKLKTEYLEEKAAIKSGKLAAIAAVRKDGQAVVDKARKRWQKVFDSKVSGLQNRRTSEVSTLEGKLAAGRAAIASMPVTG